MTPHHIYGGLCEEDEIYEIRVIYVIYDQIKAKLIFNLDDIQIAIEVFENIKPFSFRPARLCLIRGCQHYCSSDHGFK